MCDVAFPTDLLELTMRMITRSLWMFCFAAATWQAQARPAIATFSKADLARTFSAGCGAAPRGKVAVHRNASGNLVTLVAERQGETVVYADRQVCNKLQDDVLNIWRTDKGSASAQMIDRGDGVRMLIGENAELRGKRFDIERTGQYLVISQGNVSTLSAISRPYLKMGELPIDAQRVFIRKGALLIIGDNTANGQLEGRTVRILPTGLEVDPVPVALGGMPAGVRVLDYAEDSDELLLSGVDESGQPSFLLVNVGTGKSSGVTPQKPGDDSALFVEDAAVRERLTGVPGEAKAGATGGSKKETGKKGWFRF